jgi:hypothetical protein
MLLIDDLLLAPFNGLLWVAEKVRDAAQEEMDGEADAITEELRQLYLLLESGTISEDEFDTQEQRLLDRLDVIQARTSAEDSEEVDDSEEEDVDVDETPDADR